MPTGKYEIRLIGALTGPIWWPVGAICGKQIDINLTREAARFTEKPTLRQLLCHIIMEHGGDFQSCDFVADCEIVVMRDTGVRAGYRTVKSRYWPITTFKSVADMVKEMTFAADYA